MSVAKKEVEAQIVISLKNKKGQTIKINDPLILHLIDLIRKNGTSGFSIGSNPMRKTMNDIFEMLSSFNGAQTSTPTMGINNAS